MTFSMSPEEMKQLSNDLNQLFSAFSTVKTPAHPGIGVLGQPELSDAYEAFSQAAQTRVGEVGQWCNKTSEALATARKQSEQTDGQWARSFRYDPERQHKFRS